MTTSAVLPVSPGTTAQHQALHAVQAEVLESFYLATCMLGVVLMSVAATWSSEWRWGLVGIGLELVPLALYLASREHPDACAWVLIGIWLAASAVIIWWISPVLVAVLALPAALATLLLGPRSGSLVAATVSLLVLIAMRTTSGASPASLAGATAVTWGVVGLIWLGQRPLQSACSWSWQHYAQARNDLDQARDAQADLKQAIKDLAEASVQMQRLNRLLGAARRAAEEAERVKAEFVANVSHELRTPINMIIGFCEMITQTPESYGWVPDALLADLQVVLRNSRHLSGLIDDVLDLSQIEAGQMALTREWAALADVIEAAAVAVRPLFNSKSLHLQTNIATDLPAVFCDPLRIREVVLNLLSNAGRFTEHGGVQLRAWAEGGEVVVSVSDTGPGIAPEAQARLFRPFQQLDSTPRRRYGGTGLGLSISRGFIELHGGRMWVESEVGQGTTFFFRLPLEPAEHPEDASSRWFNPYQPYEDRSARARLPLPLIRPRVAVVESGQALRRLLARHMHTVEVVPCANLPTALAEASADLVLINGRSVDESLAELGRLSSLPAEVPAFVCSVPEPAVNAAHAAGAVDYLLKPVTQETLLAALARAAPAAQVVLLVDDELDALQLFERVLISAGRGYRVLKAADGREGLRMLREIGADAVVLDLTMPELDGFGFLAARNDDPALAGVPVILATAQDPVSGRGTGGAALVSAGLTVTAAGGLSAGRLIACIEALSALWGHKSPRAGPEQPAASLD